MGRPLLPAILAAVLGTAAATAEPSPHTGSEGRDIKALSEVEIGDLLGGHGAGMALPAELNHYPGPKHILELADDLGLSREQEAETRRLFERMRSEAVPLGEAVVAKEAELDRLFASGAAEEGILRTLVTEIARLRGELRFTHLKYHLAMRWLLSPGQVAAYDAARGHGPGHDGRHGTGGHGGAAPTAGPEPTEMSSTELGAFRTRITDGRSTRETGVAPLVPRIDLFRNSLQGDGTAERPVQLDDAEMGGFRWSVMRRTSLENRP